MSPGWGGTGLLGVEEPVMSTGGLPGGANKGVVAAGVIRGGRATCMGSSKGTVRQNSKITSCCTFLILFVRLCVINVFVFVLRLNLSKCDLASHIKKTV